MYNQCGKTTPCDLLRTREEQKMPSFKNVIMHIIKTLCYKCSFLYCVIVLTVVIVLILYLVWF